MKVSNLIVNRFKIECHQMVDKLAVSRSELYVSSPEPLEQNPLGRVSFKNDVCSIQELNSYTAVTAYHMAKAPSGNLILRSHLVALDPISGSM